jgi:hypothetical protein
MRHRVLVALLLVVGSAMLVTPSPVSSQQVPAAARIGWLALTHDGAPAAQASAATGYRLPRPASHQRTEGPWARHETDRRPVVEPP